VRLAINCHLVPSRAINRWQQEAAMPEPQLSVRSARARDLAHMLAKRERRTVAQVVELALERYARGDSEQPSRSSWADFVDKLERLPVQPGDPDIDLEDVIREHRVPHVGIELE
jgi:hypothetical protein